MPRQDSFICYKRQVWNRFKCRWLSRIITGLSLTMGIMTALYLREKTGVGQAVDANLFRTMTWAVSYDISGALVTGKDRQAAGRKNLGAPLQCTYKTKDDRWFILMLTNPYWPQLCKALDREDLEHDPRFETPAAISDNSLDLFNILEEVFASKNLDEWRSILNGEGIPWGPLQTLPEVVKDPQARANDFFIPMDHPVYGPMEVMSNPVALSKTPEVMRMPAPDVGQHNEEVLLELGYTKEDITRFREQQVIN
ncbi:CaiB/BaiF CoA transferase family protein [Thermodesulfobacteriota bacterium]